MAYIILSDGRKQIISAEQGEAIWRVLKAQQQPTKEQEEYCARVKRVFLNWRNESTPDDYISDHFDIIKGLCLNYFTTDQQGRRTRPDLHDKTTWRFVKKWQIAWN